MSEELSRESKLASRHRALGSGLEDWNGMGVAWSYDSNPEDEHDAIREAAGLFDVSALKKVHIRGKDAEDVVDHIMTRNMREIYTGKSAYGPVLNDDGMICDDAIIANNGDNWFMVYGTGESYERLEESIVGKNVDIEFDDDMHDLSLQGPKSVDFLNSHTPMNLHSLQYFHQQETEIFGHKCMISRTGYSGERGYEIFVGAEGVADVWDSILDLGKDEGIVPCSFSALDKVRVEAALLFYGYDMTTEITPWEVGLGWAVSRKKGDFRGKERVFASEGKEKINFISLNVDHNEALEGGELININGKNVGVVNSPVWSHRMNMSLALGHIEPRYSAKGTKVRISGNNVDTTAVITELPIYDPQKTRPHA